LVLVAKTKVNCNLNETVHKRPEIVEEVVNIYGMFMAGAKYLATAFRCGLEPLDYFKRK
jgi:hypothetical protein